MTYSTLGKPRKRFVDALAAAGCSDVVSRAEVLEVADALGMSGAPTWITTDPDRRAGRGLYSVPEILESDAGGTTATEPTPAPAPVVAAPTQVVEATKADLVAAVFSASARKACVSPCSAMGRNPQPRSRAA